MDTEFRQADPRSAADATLLQRFTAHRDGMAFAVLVDRYGGLVLGRCRRLLRHEQDAEDAFQATFLVLARKAGSIRKSESVGSWLYGVASRVARKARGSLDRQRAREADLSAVPFRFVDEDTPITDLGPVLDEAVSQLPPAFRGPVILCYLQGRTTEDAARVLGCPRGTVLSRLARARERLRKRLARRGVVLTAAAIATAFAANRAAADAPLPLAYSTIQAAAPSAAGATSAADAVSARAIVLAKGVLKGMWITKLTQVAAIVAIITLGAVGVVGSRAWADREAGAGKDAKPASLAGNWVATAVVKNGVEAPKEKVDGIKLELKDGTFTLKQGEEVVSGTFTVDPAQKPATIDLELTDGAARGEKSAGIYLLDRDTLKICSAHLDVPRPTTFESKEGSGHMLITLRRVKP